MRGWFNAVRHVAAALWQSEAGGEVLEYALIAGVISVAAIGGIAAYGSKVAAKWSSLNSSL